MANNNNNNSGLGAGFDDFLIDTSTAATPTNTPTPGQVSNAQGNANSEVNQDFLDFLSGHETPKQNPTVEQIPEIIPEISNPPEPVHSNSTDTFTWQPPAEEKTDPKVIVDSVPSSSVPQTDTHLETNVQTTRPPASPTTVNTTTTSAEATESNQVTDQLQEIGQKFGGRWRLVRSDPYNEYLKSVGVGLINRKLASSGIPVQVFTVEEDKIRIQFHSTMHNQNYVVKLNEEMNNLVEKEQQSVFCSYKDGKLVLNMTPVDQGFAKVQEVQRFINHAGEHVVIYTCGSATCRRYFQRLAPDAK